MRRTLTLFMPSISFGNIRKGLKNLFNGIIKSMVNFLIENLFNAIIKSMVNFISNCSFCFTNGMRLWISKFFNEVVYIFWIYLVCIYGIERSFLGLIEVVVEIDIFFLNEKLFWIFELLKRKICLTRDFILSISVGSNS